MIGKRRYDRSTNETFYFDRFVNILTSNTNFMLFSTGCILVFLVERYI